MVCVRFTVSAWFFIQTSESVNIGNKPGILCKILHDIPLTAESKRTAVKIMILRILRRSGMYNDCGRTNGIYMPSNNPISL